MPPTPPSTPKKRGGHPLVMPPPPQKNPRGYRDVLNRDGGGGHRDPAELPPPPQKIGTPPSLFQSPPPYVYIYIYSLGGPRGSPPPRRRLQAANGPVGWGGQLSRPQTWDVPPRPKNMGWGGRYASPISSSTLRGDSSSYGGGGKMGQGFLGGGRPPQIHKGELSPGGGHKVRHPPPQKTRGGP